MKSLNELVLIGWNPKELCEAIEADCISSADYDSKIKAIIESCDDIEVLKAAAIEFDEVPAFYQLEDKLVSLIGDDYYDFAEENDLA